MLSHFHPGSMKLERRIWEVFVAFCASAWQKCNPSRRDRSLRHFARRPGIFGVEVDSAMDRDSLSRKARQMWTDLAARGIDSYLGERFSMRSYRSRRI